MDQFSLAQKLSLKSLEKGDIDDYQFEEEEYSDKSLNFMEDDGKNDEEEIDEEMELKDENTLDSDKENDGENEKNDILKNFDEHLLLGDDNDVSNDKFMEDEKSNEQVHSAEVNEFQEDKKEGNIWYMSKKEILVSEILPGLLSKNLLGALKSVSNIHKLFAVQRAVIPSIIALHKSRTPGDFCVSSPTGSGKTLCYVLPLLECLMQYCASWKKLRALVIVPTQNLAEQVHNTFNSFQKYTRLSIGLAHGISKKFEESILVKKIRDAKSGTTRYESNIDILVTTPNRLLYHLHSTPGFSLENLQFLVLDEVDRLMSEESIEAMHSLMKNYLSSSSMKQDEKENSLMIPLPTSFRMIRKILCSATLSLTTSKIDGLGLYRPQFFTFSDPRLNKKYVLPSTLEQRIIVYNSAYKPLYLLHMLRTLPHRNFLVFVQSNIIAERLFTFLQISKETSVALYSRKHAPFKMQKFLKLFKDGQINVMVCSDIMSRGIDADVDCVINYEMPLYLKTYVHRIGRTARAGKIGYSYTFVRSSQIDMLKSKVQMIEGGDMSEYHISFKHDLSPYISQYRAYLRELSQKLKK